MEDREMASTSLMFSSPGMPKTWVTPSFSRHSTISSAVPRLDSVTTTRLGRLPGSRRSRVGGVAREDEADDSSSVPLSGSPPSPRARCRPGPDQALRQVKRPTWCSPGVAKASLYDIPGSKEELVRAY